LAFTSNGEVLMVGKGTKNGTYNDTGEIEARRVQTGEVIYTIPRAKNHDHLTYVCDSSFFTFEPLYPPSPGRIILSPNEETFGIVYTDEGWTTVILYRLSDGTLLKIFPEGTNSLTFSPDGSKIITGSTDGRVQIWQNADQTLLANIEGYDAPVAGITFAPDGESMAVEHPNSVRLRRVADGGVINEFATAVKAAYSSDGSQLALGYRDGHIEVLNSSNGVVSYEMTTHTASISQLAFTPDGQKLISIDQDCGMFVWWAADGMFLWPLQDFITEAQVVGKSRMRVANSIISSDSQYLIGSFDPIHQFGIWQIDNGSLIGTFPDGQEAYLRELTVVPNSNVFIAKGGTGSYVAYSFWDVSGGELVSEVNEDEGNRDYFGSIAISPDGQLMTDSLRNKVEIREISSAQQLIILNIDTYVLGHGSSIVLAFSPDGRFLATGSSDGTVRLWGIP
jgi:WD40 repeat protein